MQDTGTICLTPVTGRTTEDVLVCLTNTRSTLRLENVRVVVRADREASLLRSEEVRKQMRLWDWRPWSSIPGRPNSNPAESVVKKCKHHLAAVIRFADAPPDLWADACSVVQTNWNLKRGLVPRISQVPPLVFGRAARGLLPIGKLSKVPGGLPRWRPMAALGPDLTCGGGVRVAVYDSSAGRIRRHLTTVQHRDLVISSDPAWKRPVADLPVDADPQFIAREDSEAETPPDDHDERDGAGGESRDEFEEVVCEACAQTHTVTVGQAESFIRSLADEGIAFECHMLGKLCDIGQSPPHLDPNVEEYCPQHDGTSWCQGDTMKLDELLSGGGIPDYGYLRKWWPNYHHKKFKRRVDDFLRGKSASARRAQVFDKFVRALRVKVLSDVLFGTDCNFDDDLRSALVRLTNVTRENVISEAEKRTKSNPAMRAFAVVVSPKEALLKSSKEVAREWQGAIDSEFASMIDAGTVAIVPPSEVGPDDELIPSLLILTEKENGRKKARLVACGNHQAALPDGCYSSVVKHSSWMVLLAILVPLGCEVGLVDVKTAFLQTDAPETSSEKRTFLRLPSVFTKYYSPGVDFKMFLEVLKSVYGLSDAPKNWKITLVKYFGELGFKPCAYDDCILLRTNPFGVVVVYVDDLLLFCFGRNLLDALIGNIRARFKTTEPKFLRDASRLDPLSFIAHEIYVERKDGERQLVVSMETYLRTALRSLCEKKVIGSPEDLAPLHSLKKEMFEAGTLQQGERLSPEELTLLRTGIGCLAYAAQAIRWDILVPLSQLASGQSQAGTRAHLEGLRALISYVNSTIGRSVQWPLPEKPLCDFPKPFVIKVECEFDSNLPMEKSRQGLVFRVTAIQSGEFLCCFGLTSTQKTISLSSCESELKAASWASKQLIGEINLLSEVFKDAIFHKHLVGDNESTNLISNNQCSIRRVRHLVLADLFVKEITASGFVKVRSRRTAEMAADFLTKVLPETKLRTLLPLANLH